MAKDIPISDEGRASIEARFWSKVNKTGECWLWTAALSNTGYGVFMLHDRNLMLAHRVAYTLSKGAIPKGKVLDHLCRNPACVNPDHAEVVEQGENIRRGVMIQRALEACAAKTHCPQGHPYNEENTYLWRGRRQCRACSAAKMRRRTAASREVKLASRPARFCIQCSAPLPVEGRADKKFCSQSCFKKAKGYNRRPRLSA